MQDEKDTPYSGGVRKMEVVPPLWAHQAKAIEMAKTLPGLALFMDTGVGKTRTLIEILRHRFNTEKRIMRVLILGPVITVLNWKAEIQKFSKIPPAKVLPLLGSGKRRLEMFNEFAFDPQWGEVRGGIVVTNYEGLLMEPLYEAFQKWSPESLVLDESHRTKDMKAKRTKLAVKLSDKARHKYLLSGSPILNSPMDIYAQYRILDGGATFGKNFFAFRATYFYDKNAGMPRDRYFPNWVIRPGALEVMNRKIYSKAVRAVKSECLDLPPFIRQEVFVELSSDQARMYKEMKQDFVSYLGDKACVATMALTKALRLQQIVSGFAKLEDGKEREFSDNPRAQALKDLLSDITPAHKVLVWSVFKANYDTIRQVCESLGVKYVEVHGEIPNKQKFENVDKFNADPEVRVLIGHPGSAGIGINMVAASYSIWYSRSFSLEHNLQAEARNFRGGSEIHEKITRIDLIARGTIDELVLRALSDKQEISFEMLKTEAEKI